MIKGVQSISATETIGEGGGYRPASSMKAASTDDCLYRNRFFSRELVSMPRRFTIVLSTSKAITYIHAGIAGGTSAIA